MGLADVLRKYLLGTKEEGGEDAIKVEVRKLSDDDVAFIREAMYNEAAIGIEHIVQSLREDEVHFHEEYGDIFDLEIELRFRSTHDSNGDPALIVEGTSFEEEDTDEEETG